MLRAIAPLLALAVVSCGKTIPNYKNMRDRQSSFTNAPDNILFPDDQGKTSGGTDTGGTATGGTATGGTATGGTVTGGTVTGGTATGGTDTGGTDTGGTDTGGTDTGGTVTGGTDTGGTDTGGTVTGGTDTGGTVTGGTNTEDATLVLNKGEYLISNCSQLQAIPNGTTGVYKLINNIDCSASASWNGGQGFIPLQSFKGKFNGNRKIISNITIKPASTYDHETGIGVIGFAENAEIYDVGVYNAVVRGAGRKVGILLGHGAGTKITRSFTTGSVTNTLGNIDQYWTWSATGGLVGYLRPSNPEAAVIMDSYSEATVVGATDYTGGLIGVIDAGSPSTLIKRSYATGNVTSAGGRTGALTTYSWNQVEDSFATGIASGGLCQMVFGSITNSYYGNSGGSNCGTNQGSPSDYKGNVFNESKAPFTSWDFENIWTQVQDNYPRLQGFAYPDNPALISVQSNSSVSIAYIGDGNSSGYWKLAGTCSNNDELIKITHQTQSGGNGYTYVPCVDGTWIFNEIGSDVTQVGVTHDGASASMLMSNPTAWTGPEIDCSGSDPYTWRQEMTDAFGQMECHTVAYCSSGRPYAYVDTISAQCAY